MKDAWHIYILRCADGTFYTGVTTDLKRRMSEHNESSKGAKYTRVRRPVSLIHSETFESRSAACVREAAIKKLSRDEKSRLVEG